jgi:hypothetical protein
MCISVRSTKRLASRLCCTLDGRETIAEPECLATCRRLRPSRAPRAEAPPSEPRGAASPARALADCAALGAGVAAATSTAGGLAAGTAGAARPSTPVSTATRTTTPHVPSAIASSHTPRSEGGVGISAPGSAVLEEPVIVICFFTVSRPHKGEPIGTGATGAPRGRATMCLLSGCSSHGQTRTHPFGARARSLDRLCPRGAAHRRQAALPVSGAVRPAGNAPDEAATPSVFAWLGVYPLTLTAVRPPALAAPLGRRGGRAAPAWRATSPSRRPR